MTVDRFGNTIVAGNDVALAGPIRDIVGTDVLVVLAGGKHALRAHAADVFRPDAIPAAPIVDVDFTYVEGAVSSIEFDSGVRTLDFTYNADGSVDTITDDSPAHTKAFSYNADGTVAGIVIT